MFHRTIGMLNPPANNTAKGRSSVAVIFVFLCGYHLSRDGSFGD